MLGIEVDGQVYLSQEVFEQSLIAKYSANPLLFWEDNAVNYNCCTVFGMSAGSVPVECLLSVTGIPV